MEKKADPGAVCLAPMTAEMYRRYFREYENDPDLYADKAKHTPYVYCEDAVERYIRRQSDMKRIPLAIMFEGEIVGEIVIKNIEEHVCATMGLALKNASYKDRGIGTAAERLAVRYVFDALDIPLLYADALRTNTRSRHVLEKVGFTPIGDDGEFVYYAIARSGPETSEIVGANYFGHWEQDRIACRGIVVRDSRLLLSHERATDTWMLPGGGLEPGEDEQTCCIREVSEETGFVLRLSPLMLEINEYYENLKYISRYYFGTITGQCERKLTAREAEAGMEPAWLPIDEALELFSRHAAYADSDEMKRGLYLREYTALRALLIRDGQVGS